MGDGGGRQLDTGFGAGWSNNLNEGSFYFFNMYLEISWNRGYDSNGFILKYNNKRASFGENVCEVYAKQILSSRLKAESHYFRL